MLQWLAGKTENSEIHKRMELPAVRRDISKIILSYTSSTFFQQFQEGITSRRLQKSRGESALKIAERQIDNPIARYYSRAHPEIAAYIGEDWVPDHNHNLSQTAAAMGQTITDPGSIYLEVIAPEIILLWIMEDLRIDQEDASRIQQSPQATDYGRLVLEPDCIAQQAVHQTNAHRPDEGSRASTRWQMRKRQPPKRR